MLVTMRNLTWKKITDNNDGLHVEQPFRVADVCSQVVNHIVREDSTSLSSQESHTTKSEMTSLVNRSEAKQPVAVVKPFLVRQTDISTQELWSNNQRTSVRLNATLQSPSTATTLAADSRTASDTNEPRASHLVSQRPAGRRDELSATIVSPRTKSENATPDGYSRIVRCRDVTSTAIDEQRLTLNCRLLDECSFYCGGMSSAEAKERLRDTLPGTFVVRDSAHARFLYSLSLKTRRGVTSIRLQYDANGFSLDSEPDKVAFMLVFNTVLDLVAHYMAEVTSSHGANASAAVARSSCVFVDRAGRCDLPVVLRSPYRSSVSSLKHLSRVAINSALRGRCFNRLALNPTLKEYIAEYPFEL